MLATASRPLSARGEAARPLVCHVITTLETGGAQMMLFKLLSAKGASRFAHTVVCLGPEDGMAERIRALGVRVVTLDLDRSGRNIYSCFASLVRHLKAMQPAVVQTWMHHSDLLGGLAARLAGLRTVLWGIRHSDLDPKVTKRRTLWIARLCGILSPWIPARILCCSEASRRTHALLGYRRDKMTVICNGFDTLEFRPRPECRREVRSELGLPMQAELVGLFARYHPMKDHGTFLAAARMVSSERPNVYFVLCGSGAAETNRELCQRVREAGLESTVKLLGRRDDLPRLTAALDVAVSSSRSGEGFSNAIGEAMSCGLVCVATNVGDAAAIVGHTGIVVPAARPDALARALLDVLEAGPEQRALRGAAARRRIEQHFGIGDVAARFASLYSEVIEGANR